MMRHKGVHSQKFVEKRRKERQVFLFLGTLATLTFLAALILLLRAPFFQIKTIIVEGTSLVSKEAVSGAALASLGGNYFGTIPHSNALFFSKKRIEDALQGEFKHINVFTIHRSGITGLRLTIEERIPAAVVCPGFREETEQGGCFLSDDKGYIFGMTATSVPRDLLEPLSRYYVPAEDGLAPGNNFVPEKRFAELQKFLRGALKGGLVPLGVLIGEQGEYEMYIKNLRGDSEVTVYFDDRASFDTTLENLLTFWDNTVVKKKASAPAFDYINLRFGNTVYYSTE